ncbi:PhaM family polyhydroxyalkanoate granule multifunctional regulatory protein [Paucibacter soli]|uniref:PhaM family polyhydroxyalkanoate granule multifunctional regulatory protein n=1 Tax=Paucibacter soli TaxID=3133433 RepID=UPI00309B5109
MADNSFTKFVPGFEFLQGLVKNAGAALPGIGQWVAPTINPEELSKRIEELRTVQFWLEQNARMLGATIQALEVQRMTLSTLKSMNVPINELSAALKVPTPDLSNWPGVPPGVAKAAKKAAAKAAPKAEAAAGKDEAAKPAAPVVDPMQWWGALSQQFTQLAANAMKDSATDAAKNLAGAIVKQSFDAAGETLKKAASVPGAVVGSMANTMADTVGKTLATKPAAKRSSSGARAAPARKRKT